MQRFGEMCITTYRDNTHHSRYLGWLYWRSSHWYILGFQPQDKKDYFDERHDFSTEVIWWLQQGWKTCVGNYEIERLDEELKLVPIINNYNNSNVVSDSICDKDTKNDNKIFSTKIDDEVKVTPKPTINTKVVQAMKKLQALYNDHSNKIVKQATQEKNAIKNLNFSIVLAMVTNDTKPTTKEPQTFNKDWNHPN